MARQADGSIVIDTKIDDAKLKKGISNIGTSLKGITKLVATAFSVKVIYNFTKACIQAASDLEEVQNVVDVVFGESSEIINNFAKNAVKSLGLSELSAKQYASTMGAMLKSMKLSDKQVLTMSQNLTALAGDMASFYNISGDEAFTKLRAGISGETEPLKQLGINLNVANLEAYALSKGIDKSFNSMSQAEQAIIRYNYLLDVTKDAQGDFSRTSGNWANQVRVLSEQWNTFKSVLGSSFIQVLTPIIQALNKIMEKLILAGKYFQRFVYMLTGVKPETNGATKAVEGLGGSLDDATDKAKKTKKALQGLQGFDKLNVLDSGSDSDSDSSGGSSGMSIDDPYDFSDAITATDALDGAFEEIDNKLKQIKDVFKSVWDSAIVQSFVYAVKSYIQYIYDFVVSMGEALWENMQLTWENIRLDVETMLSNITELWTTFWTDLGDTINEYSQPIIEGMTELFNSVWTEAIDPLIKTLTKAWSDFTGILLELWNKYGKDILDGIGEFVTNTIDLFQSIWDNVLEPIITPFLETLSWLWDKHISKMVKAIGEFLATVIDCALQLYNKFIKPIVSWLLEKLAPAWSFLSSTVIGIVGTIVGTISDLVTGITKILTGIIKFITGIFTGDWKKAWEGVKSIFTGIWDSLSGVVKGVLNVIIDVLNGFISGINKISFDVPDWVPIIGGKKWGFDIPKIKKFENGGVLFKETVGVMAEYDNARFNPEIVSKESEMAKVFDGVMSKWVNKINSGSGKMTGTLRLVDSNGATLGKVVVDAIDAYSDELGYNPL
jgi:phage-related protein